MQSSSNPPFGLFITGTDTSVGKTFVTVALAKLLTRQGHAVRVCKPVATGAVPVNGQRWSADTLRLAEAVGAEPGSVTRWTFGEAAAPPVAARLEGQSLDLAELLKEIRSLQRANEALLIEGVGGLLCPLTECETIADLALELAMPVLIVARRSLGTLNHSLLTLEVAQRRGLPVVGVVVVETEPPRTVAEQTNVAELAKRIDVPLLAVVAFQVNPSGEPSVSLAAVDWWSLCRRPLRESAR